MNKLFWSAFAVSLIIFPLHLCAQLEDIDDFMGLNDEEVIPVFKGPKKLDPPEMHEKPNATSEVIEPAFGDKFSTIPWSTQDPQDFLSISTWIAERDLKDQNPDWRSRLRAGHHQELVGKVLQCSGSCHVYRGTEKARVQHLSQILEGDEINIGKDSLAWIYFMDGSLMRLSAGSSLSFHEINFSKTEVFFMARLNQGHVYWHPRSKKEFVLDDGPETDTLSLPLMIREANQEAFERRLFKKHSDSERVAEMFNLNMDSVQDQFKFLNKTLVENNPDMTLSTRMMLVSPNGSVVAKNGSFDFVFIPGGKSYFKKRNSEEGDEYTIHLRGYSGNAPQVVTEDKWHEIDPTGRNLVALEDVPGPLIISELLTKRIKTLELAREIWVRKFTIPVMKSLATPDLTTKDFGYVVWGDDLNKRFDFLVEYTRRIETTNLRSIENLIVKLQEKGEFSSRELSNDLYQKSLNHYLFGLKKRYDKKKMRVRELNDLQYYVWILRNGKL